MQPLWELLSSTTICYIWKDCCSSIFCQARAIWLDIIHSLPFCELLSCTTVQLVRNIWLDMIHTYFKKDNGIVLLGIQMLKLFSISNLLLFRKILHFCPSKIVGPLWHFQPPRWMFPLPITTLCKFLYANEWISL